MNLVNYDALLKYFVCVSDISASSVLDITLFILFTFSFGNKLD